MIAGHDNTSYEQILAMAQNKTTATQIRAKTYGKTDNQDIVIHFGGYDWNVCYLSTDDAGNAILTVTMTNPFTRGVYGGWYSGGYGSCIMATHAYHVSYVRAVGLNNGGYYTNGQFSMTGNIAKQVNHPMSVFTMSDVEGSLVDCLVMPESIDWQRNNYQKATEILGFQYNNSNENWSDPSSEGFYSTTGNSNDSSSSCWWYYGNSQYYDQWKTDYLWLPSLCEYGVNDSNVGLWRLRNVQRSCNFDCWTRTPGPSSGNQIYIVKSDGTVVMSETYYGWEGSQPLGFRPAVHINLNAAKIKPNHDYGDWSEDTATCLETGSKTRICAICAHEETCETAALGHLLDGTTITAATCTMDGEIIYTCRRCEYTKNEKIDALGHDYQTHDQVPTCTESGGTLYLCTRCGDNYLIEPIPAVGHEWVINDTVTADCGHAGYIEYVCTRCEHSYKEMTDPATGEHAYPEEWTRVLEPTKSIYGIDERSCIHCGHTQIRRLEKLPFFSVESNESVPLLQVIAGGVGILIALLALIIALISLMHSRDKS